MWSERERERLFIHDVCVVNLIIGDHGVEGTRRAKAERKVTFLKGHNIILNIVSRRAHACIAGEMHGETSYI